MNTLTLPNVTFSVAGNFYAQNLSSVCGGPGFAFDGRLDLYDQYRIIITAGQRGDIGLQEMTFRSIDLFRDLFVARAKRARAWLWKTDFAGYVDTLTHHYGEKVPVAMRTFSKRKEFSRASVVVVAPSRRAWEKLYGSHEAQSACVWWQQMEGLSLWGEMTGFGSWFLNASFDDSRVGHPPTQFPVSMALPDGALMLGALHFANHRKMGIELTEEATPLDDMQEKVRKMTRPLRLSPNFQEVHLNKLEEPYFGALHDVYHTSVLSTFSGRTKRDLVKTSEAIAKTSSYRAGLLAAKLMREYMLDGMPGGTKASFKNARYIFSKAALSCNPKQIRQFLMEWKRQMHNVFGPSPHDQKVLRIFEELFMSKL